MELNNDHVKRAMQGRSDYELVAIIEMGEDAYTTDALMIANEELMSRKLLHEAVQAFSKTYWQEHIRKNLKSILFNDTKLTSQFVEEQILIELVKAEVESFRERQELFGLDMQAYWGAALL
jgi:hypothetical protein